MFLARTGECESAIRRYIERQFGHDLGLTVAAIRPRYRFDITCQGSVPELLIAFVESDSYEDAVRNAVWLGGDADTVLAVAGSVAEAHFGLPGVIARQARAHLTTELYGPIDAFTVRFDLRSQLAEVVRTIGSCLKCIARESVT